MFRQDHRRDGVVGCYLGYREGLNKNINKFGGIFHRGEGSTHSNKIINYDQQINTSQNDPNDLKHEINQYKYFTNCDPYPPSHLAEYLTMTSILLKMSFKGSSSFEMSFV